MRIRPILLGVVFCATSCKSLPADNSRAKDLFTADQSDQAAGNGRRRPAATAEQADIAFLNPQGCTGFLLSPDYLMTAGHCVPMKGNRYTSANAMAHGAKDDITVTKVVEFSPTNRLDYAIMQITWKDGVPPGVTFVGKVATQAGEVVALADAGKGDAVYTVGYPLDKVSVWGATYDDGELKQVSGDNIKFDVGIINGNSGGPLLRKSDGLLVALTNGGPHQYEEAGWDSAKVADSKSWNYGPSLWSIYAQSPILKQIFPGGIYSAKAEAALVASGGGKEIKPLPATDVGIGVNEYLIGFHKPHPVTDSSQVLFGAPEQYQIVSGGSFNSSGAPCTSDGMQAELLMRSPPVIASISLTSHYPATGDNCSLLGVPRRYVAYQLTKSSTSPCGLVTYDGEAAAAADRTTVLTLPAGMAPSSANSEATATAPMFLANAGGSSSFTNYAPRLDVATTNAAGPTKIHIEDASKATCTPAPPANFIMTETHADGAVTVLYGNRRLLSSDTP